MVNEDMNEEEVDKPEVGVNKSIKKEKPIKKKEKKPKESKKPKVKKLLSLPEPSQQVLRAAMGGLTGVLAVVALTYVLWGIITSDSILYAGSMIDVLSMGNGFNSLLGVWALAFTPLTSIGSVNEYWIDNWYYALIPTLVGGLIIGLISKRISTSILGGLFFIFWGIVIPLLFVYVFSVFGLCDPTLVDSILTGILKNAIDDWNYDFLYDLFNENLFLTWSSAGAIELGILATIVAIPIGLILQLIGK